MGLIGFGAQIVRRVVVAQEKRGLLAQMRISNASVTQKTHATLTYLGDFGEGFSRLAKREKPQFAGANEDFECERNAENTHQNRPKKEGNPKRSPPQVRTACANYLTVFTIFSKAWG